MTERREFYRRIERFSSARRHLLNATLVYRLSSVALVAGIATLVLLSGWLPGVFVNLALFAALAILLAALLVMCPVKWSHRRETLFEAFVMEELSGELNSRLISAWDFLENDWKTPLTLAVIEQARQDLDFAFEEKLDKAQRNLRRKQFAALLALFIAIGLTPWFGFARVKDNFDRTWAAALDYLFPIQYTVTPEFGQHIHRLNEQVNVALQFEREGYSQIRLVRETADGKSESSVLDVDSNLAARQRITSDVEAEYTLHFEFGQRRTKEIKLIFTTAPSLVNMQTELVYPAYTAMLPRPLEGIQQRLLGLPGTRMTLGFTFSKDLEWATLTWEDGQELPLETLGRFASIGLVHQQARRGKLQVRDLHGLEMDDPLLIDFDLQVDEKPQLFLPKHLKEDMPLLEADVVLFGFGVRVQDDYGVTRCVLKWQKSSVDSPTTIVDQGEVERLISPSQRTAMVNYEKIFSSLALRPGDKITFEVEANDNRTPEKQTTRSRRYSFFVYQQELGGMSINQLGFGGPQDVREGRIAKSTKATAVKAPEGLKTRELVRNEHEANVVTGTQAPTVRGEHGKVAQDYFRLMSKVPYESEPGQATPGGLKATPQSPADPTIPPPQQVPDN